MQDLNQGAGANYPTTAQEFTILPVEDLGPCMPSRCRSIWLAGCLIVCLNLYLFIYLFFCSCLHPKGFRFQLYTDVQGYLHHCTQLCL